MKTCTLPNLNIAFALLFVNIIFVTKALKCKKGYDTITLENKTYNMLKAQLEILTSLVEGQNDIIQGRTTTIEETFNSIDKMIHQLD